MHARRVAGLAVVVALLGLVGTPVAQAQGMAHEMTRMADQTPVVGPFLHVALGLFGAYEDPNTYVSLRDAHGPSDDQVDRDSALFAGD